jgi:hypothetical protein
MDRTEIGGSPRASAVATEAKRDRQLVFLALLAVGGPVLVLVGGLVFLYVVALEPRDSKARAAVDRYVETQRLGGGWQPRLADGDADEANRRIAESTKLTIDDSLASKGLGSRRVCFKAALRTPHGEVPIFFLVEQRGEPFEIERVSTRAGCKCGDDTRVELICPARRGP